MDNQTNNNPPDLLMWVGKEYYTVGSFIKEAKKQGVSKRISITSIPEGLEQGRSRVLICHPEAILKVTDERWDIGDFMDALFDHGLINLEEALFDIDRDELYWQEETLQPMDFVPADMLKVVMALDKADKKLRDDLIDKYKIIWHPGIIGYAYLTRLEYVCKEGETTLPPDLAHLDGYVQPVIVERDDDREWDIDE